MIVSASIIGTAISLFSAAWLVIMCFGLFDDMPWHRGRKAKGRRKRGELLMRCPGCSGTGHTPGRSQIMCTRCVGKGYLNPQPPELFGDTVFESPKKRKLFGWFYKEKKDV